MPRKISEDTEIRLLKFLTNELVKPMTKSEVSKALGIDLNILERLLKRHEKNGLVKLEKMGRFTFLKPVIKNG